MRFSLLYVAGFGATGAGLCWSISTFGRTPVNVAAFAVYLTVVVATAVLRNGPPVAQSSEGGSGGGGGGWEPTGRPMGPDGRVPERTAVPPLTYADVLEAWARTPAPQEPRPRSAPIPRQVEQ